MKKNLVRLVGGLLLLGAIILLVRLSGVEPFLERGGLQSWISGYGMLAPLVYIFFFAVAPALFFPGLPITLAGGLAFGPLWGTVYTSLGSTLGASLAFLISRYLARGTMESFLSGRFLRIDEGIARQGWVFVAVTRLVPLFPFNLLNYAFGLTKVRFRTYLWASWLFMLPGTAAYTVFGASLPDLLRGRISGVVIAGILLVVLVSLIPVLYRARQRGRLPAPENHG